MSSSWSAFAGIKAQVREGIAERSPDGAEPPVRAARPHQPDGFHSLPPTSRRSGAILRNHAWAETGIILVDKPTYVTKGGAKLDRGSLPPQHLSPLLDAARNSIPAPSLPVHSRASASNRGAASGRGFADGQADERADSACPARSTRFHPHARGQGRHGAPDYTGNRPPACSSAACFPRLHTVKGQGAFPAIIRDFPNSKSRKRRKILVRPVSRTALKRRRRGSVIRPRDGSQDAGSAARLRCKQGTFPLPTTRIFLVDGVLAMNELSQLHAVSTGPDLEFVPYVPRHPEAGGAEPWWATSSPRSVRRT